MNQFHQHNRINFWPFILLVWLLNGCISTKYIPENRYLMNDISIKVDNDNIDKEELVTHLRQKENLKILAIFKFHLWLYNLSGIKRENGWLKRIGEPPVIYDTGLKNKSVQQLEQYLYNKGYYQAVVMDTVIFRNKKANIIYRIQTGEPYVIRNINNHIKDNAIAILLNSPNFESLLKPGDIFDVDKLEQERLKITNLLKNEGYYKFAKEYIHYKVDSTHYNHLVDIVMILENPGIIGESEQEWHKKYKITNYSIYIDKQKKSEMGSAGITYSDTTRDDGFSFYYNGKMPLRENLFFKTIEIKPGDEYTKRKEDKTYNNLYALRQFKYVNIQYFENLPNTDSLVGTLQGKIFLPLQVKQNYSFDVEGTNTSGNLGIAGNLNYQHRNLLGGAEIFDVSIKGGTERQLAIIDNENKVYNTREFGGEVKLTIPGFLLPVDQEKFNLYSLPFTSFSMAYNYQDRPDYTRTIVNATFGYQWKSSIRFTHNINLLDLNAVRIFSLNSTFIDQIKDLYIKSSYSDHIISSSSYNLTFNNQGFNKRPDYHYFRMNLETSGNFLWAVSAFFARKKYYSSDPNSLDKTSYYKYFDTRFAQYVKGDFDYRYGYRLDKFNLVATRVFAGIAYPYGNFNVIPFEKRYFTGGANGVRAWQVRSLGPGTYVAAADEYPNQSADIKLEANIEYRFKLFWMFEGALFADAGNIWAINQFDNREGAVFHFNQFYKEFALGSGFGLRLVSSYFILRADLGLKLRDPSLADGARWILQTRSFNSTDLNLNIAIGYPF